MHLDTPQQPTTKYDKYYYRRYYAANKKAIQLNRKKAYEKLPESKECFICGGKYMEHNHAKHRVTKKHITAKKHMKNEI
jgi:hypothetical protein